MEKYAFQDALVEVLRVVSRANKYIDETAPWALAKDETKKARLACVLYNLLETIRLTTVLLQPFTPTISEKAWAQIGADISICNWDNAATFGLLPRTATVQKGDALFPRIDVQKELEALEAGI